MKRILVLILALILALPALALGEQSHTFVGIPWDTTFDNAADVASQCLGIKFTADTKNNLLMATSASPLSMGGVVARQVSLLYTKQGKENLFDRVMVIFPAPNVGYYNGSDKISRFTITDPDNSMEKIYQYLISNYGNPTHILTYVTSNGKEEPPYNTEQAPIMDTLEAALRLPTHKKFRVALGAEFDNVMFYVSITSDGNKMESGFAVSFASPILYPSQLTDLSRLPVFTVTPKEIPLK